MDLVSKYCQIEGIQYIDEVADFGINRKKEYELDIPDYFYIPSSCEVLSVKYELVVWDPLVETRLPLVSWVSSTWQPTVFDFYYVDTDLETADQVEFLVIATSEGEDAYNEATQTFVVTVMGNKPPYFTVTPGDWTTIRARYSRRYFIYFADDDEEDSLTLSATVNGNEIGAETGGLFTVQNNYFLLYDSTKYADGDFGTYDITITVTDDGFTSNQAPESVSITISAFLVGYNKRPGADYSNIQTLFMKEGQRASDSFTVLNLQDPNPADLLTIGEHDEQPVLESCIIVQDEDQQRSGAVANLQVDVNEGGCDYENQSTNYHDVIRVHIIDSNSEQDTEFLQQTISFYFAINFYQHDQNFVLIYPRHAFEVVTAYSSKRTFEVASYFQCNKIQKYEAWFFQGGASAQPAGFGAHSGGPEDMDDWFVSAEEVPNTQKGFVGISFICLKVGGVDMYHKAVLNIEVKAVNFAPELDPILDVTMDLYDTPEVRNIVFSDKNTEDTQTIEVYQSGTFAPLPPWVAVDLNAKTIKVTYDQCSYKHLSPLTVEVRVVDNDIFDSGAIKEDSTTFTITLNFGNSDPQFSAIADIELYRFQSRAFQLPVSDPDPDDDLDLSCGLVGGGNLPNFMQLKGSMFYIFSSVNNDQVGDYDIECEGQDNDSCGSGVIGSASVQFKVTQKPWNTAPYFLRGLDRQNYDVYMYDFQSLKFPGFADLDSTDKLELRVLKNDGSQPNSFMSIDQDARTLNCFTENVFDTFVDYEIILQVIDDNSNAADNGILTDTIYLNVKIHKVNRPPFFNKDTDDQEVMVGESLIISFSYDDKDENDILTIRVPEDDILPMGMLLDSANRLQVFPFDNSQVGKYKIKLEVWDNDSIGAGQIFSDSTTVEIEIVGNPLLAGYIDPSLAALEYHISTESTEETPRMEITKISQKGLVTLEFNQELFVPSNLTLIDDSVLDIQLFQTIVYMENQETLTGWYVKNMTGYSLEIQLEFLRPSFISAFSVRDFYFQVLDQLQIVVLDPLMFISKENLQTVLLKAKHSAEVPAQSTSYQNSKGAVNSSVFAFLASNFIVNIALSASLNLIWSMMNTLQIIVYMPLLNLQMPSNAYITALVFQTLANFDFLPSKLMFNSIFDLDPKELELGDRFVNLGFEDTNFFMNGGTFLWLFVFWVLATAVYCLTSLLIKHGKTIQYLKKANTMLFFSFVIRLWIEAYVEVSLSSAIQLTDFNQRSRGDTGSSYISSMVIISVISTPFLVHYLTNHGIRQMKKERFKELTVEFKADKYSQNFYFYFFLRRAAFIATILFFRGFLVAQLALFSVTSYSTLCYLLLVNPYKLSYLNKIEIFNESCTLGISYLLFVFSDYQDDPDLKYISGWLFCSVFFLILFFNAGFMLYSQVIMFLVVKYSKYKMKNRKAATTDLKNETNVTLIDQTIDFISQPKSISKSRKSRKGTKRRLKMSQKLKEAKQLERQLQTEDDQQNAKLKLSLLPVDLDKSKKPQAPPGLIEDQQPQPIKILKQEQPRPDFFANQKRESEIQFADTSKVTFNTLLGEPENPLDMRNDPVRMEKQNTFHTKNVAVAKKHHSPYSLHNPVRMPFDRKTRPQALLYEPLSKLKKPRNSMTDQTSFLFQRSEPKF